MLFLNLRTIINALAFAWKAYQMVGEVLQVVKLAQLAIAVVV